VTIDEAIDICAILLEKASVQESNDGLIGHLGINDGFDSLEEICRIRAGDTVRLSAHNYLATRFSFLHMAH
jgi:hypothetical protein